MTPLEVFKSNKNSLKLRDITLNLFKFNTKRDKVKKDSLYIFSTNYANNLGKWHKLGVFYVQKIEGRKIHAFNLLYIEKPFLEVFVQKGLNSQILEKMFFYTKVELDTSNIIRSELLSPETLGILPLLKLELIGINSNIHLIKDFKSYKPTKIKVVEKPKETKPLEKKEDFVEDHEIDLDVLFDEGKIKHMDV